jgi:hypothetical protein
MTRPIPIDDRGYAVDLSGIVHSRYANHATGQRTRTFVGVMSIAGGRTLEPCDVCYPPPPPPRKRPTSSNAGDTPAQVRASGWRREPDPEVAETPVTPVDEAAEILPEPEAE